MIVKRRERGRVQRTIRRLAMVIRSEHTPGPSSQDTETQTFVEIDNSETETTNFEINL